VSESFIRPAPLRATAAALRSGETDLRAYLQNLCDWIDEAEPHVRALLPEPDRRGRLLRDAETLRARYPDPVSRPPLYGVPVGVKDIFRVDGFPTRAGSELPPALFEGPEAPVVTRLKEAGALFLGKTVTTEFAYFEPGPTRNPHNPDHTPGGSSSGSAAAVAAGFCPLALGSQTVGSVIRPAAFCGVFGFKPSFELLSTEGVIPYAPSLDHVGFFVQEPEGLAFALSVLTGEPEHVAPGWCPLGVPEGPYLEQASPEAREHFERQVARLEVGGRTIRRFPVLAQIERINHLHQRLAAAQMAHTHRGWFHKHAALYRPRTADWVRLGGAVSRDEVRLAQSWRARVRDELEAPLKTTSGDAIGAWICPPATGPAPEGLHSTGDPMMNLPWTFAGMPVAAVPAGRAANGLPMGVQLIAHSGEDRWLAALANQIYQELNH
jgi:Asp-tRNA(Asn)/Glu-tRNA(Gln) amidotransferase A subunit family amidase